MVIQGIEHSCCPSKRDIKAPRFEPVGKPFTFKTGTSLAEWKCTGCGTVIYVATVPDAPSEPWRWLRFWRGMR